MYSPCLPTSLQVWQHSTVFELAGQDRSGLLADVLQLLTLNGCNVRSAAVWTYSGRAAFVVSVVEGCGQPIRDASKLLRLKQLLHKMMDMEGTGIVTAQPVKGLIHYERRLHQLLLKEEEKEWLRSKDQILSRLRLKTANCSCSCHAPPPLPPSQQQQQPGGSSSSSVNGPGGAAALMVTGMQQQQLGGSDGGFAPGTPPSGMQSSAKQLQQQQQLSAQAITQAVTAASVGGACCCCQIEQAERHIVSSEHSLGSVTPTSHHTPSSSAGTLDELTQADKLLVSPKFSRPHVTIQHYSHLNYWLVTIRCKDRNKLFFDTVCTLSDLNYDVYHGAIDQVGGVRVDALRVRQRLLGLVMSA